MPERPLFTASEPLHAVETTAGMRLAYVLRHFALAYEEVPTGLIGYAGHQLPITLVEAADDFFRQQQPYPAPPNYREWAGRQIPFFFDGQPSTSPLEKAPGRVRINVDIVAAAFYLLSGWQEYFSETRDQHGRFPFAASVQRQYGFVAVPVVNYYFDVLRTAVEHVTGKPLRPRHWATGARFAAFISHDIDTLRSAWKAPAKAALRSGQVLRFGQLLWQRITQPDAWDNLETVAATVAEYGARATFFILPEHRPAANGTRNADYRLDSRLWKRFDLLRAQGSELALHGSIGTATDLAWLSAEIEESFAEKTCGIRFHFLCWEPRQTPAVLEMLLPAGLRYDSTLGFAEHFGFRHSYCHPFYPFDFTRGQAHSFLEIPLQVMDATLHHPNYLQLRAETILPVLTPLFAEVEKFGGVTSILWHNDHFDPANTVTGPQQFADIMQYLCSQGAAFLTGSQIVAELCGP